MKSKLLKLYRWLNFGQIIFLALTIFSITGSVQAAENSTLTFVVQSTNFQTNEVSILAPSQQFSKPLNITLLDHETGELFKSFVFNKTYHSEEVLLKRYDIFIEQGTEEIILDNNGSGYTSNDIVIVPLYCDPSPVTCQLEDQFHLDFPWRIEPSKNIPIIGAINTPVKIKYVKVYDTKFTSSNSDDVLIINDIYSPSLEIFSSDLPYFFEYSVNPSVLTKQNNNVEMRIVFGVDALIDYDNDEGPLQSHLSSYSLPTLWNWHYGDTHYHSAYTYNDVEFGGSITSTISSGEAIGLDWVTLTDHSFDLDTDSEWNARNSLCRSSSTSSFICIPAEEISCDNPGTGNYNHYLGYDFPNRIFSGEWPDGTGSPLQCSNVVQQVNNQGGFGYVAHPFAKEGWGITYRNVWQNYSLDFGGLEVWNGKNDAGLWGGYTSWEQLLADGIDKWVELLTDGRHVFIEGGSDAHGNFNSDYGTVRTLVYSSSGLTEIGILDALRNGHSIMTDGPLVTFTINGEIIGNTTEIAYETSPTLEISWKSTPEFGDIGNIKIYRGDSTGEGNPVFDNHPSLFPGGYSGTLQDGYATWTDPTPLTLNSYYRIEVSSSVGFPPNNVDYRAYTNPIWVDVWPYCTVSQGASVSIQQTCIDDPYPPEAPSLVWPGPSETISDSTPTLVWNKPNDTGSGVDYYQIDVDGTVNFYGDTSPQPSYTWPTTLSNGPHTWKVQARDGAGNYGNWSETRTFIVDTVNNEQTTTGSISESHACNSITVTATYSGDIDNDGSATLDYKLSSSGTWGGGIPMTDQGTEYEKTITGLNENSNYDVEVTYVDPDGIDGSPTIMNSITTPACPLNNPPYDVDITSPANGATYDLGDTITFSSKQPGGEDQI